MKQLINFKGVSKGKMHPTDIDAIIEYKNLAYIIIEVKYNGKNVPIGQDITLRRLINDTSHKTSVAIVCDHYVEDTDVDVDLARCNVREVYTSAGMIWRPPKFPIRVGELVDLIINDIKKEGTQ